MDTNKKYTYEDWWNGEICLNTSTIVYNIEKDKEKLPPITWEQVKETDKLRIQEKQTELFHFQVTQRLNELKIYFQKRYDNSRYKAKFLKEEIKKVNSVLYGNYPTKENIIIGRHNGIFFKNFNLQSIQLYTDRYIINGEPLVFDFMHSPHYPFQVKEIPNEIYAESMWQFREYLIAFIKSLQKKESSENPESKAKQETPIEVEHIEIENPTTNIEKAENTENAVGERKLSEEDKNYILQIFKNFDAYDMFLELKELTVKTNTKTADYGFIFHQMSGKHLLAINEQIKESHFIKFLNKMFSAEIKANQLKFRNPKYKEKIYKSVLDKYLKKVNSGLKKGQ